MVMVNFVCPFDRATGCPDIRSSIILDISVSVSERDRHYNW